MKVYIVEDHESMRLILKRLLKRNFPFISAIGESETAEDALEDIPAFEPDVALVDISLPGMDGIELIRRLKQRHRSLYILVVTGHEVDVYRESALAAGADDIVSKFEDDRVMQSVRELLERRGETDESQ